MSFSKLHMTALLPYWWVANRVEGRSELFQTVNAMPGEPGMNSGILREQIYRIFLKSQAWGSGKQRTRRTWGAGRWEQRKPRQDLPRETPDLGLLVTSGAFALDKALKFSGFVRWMDPDPQNQEYDEYNLFLKMLISVVHFICIKCPVQIAGFKSFNNF